MDESLIIILVIRLLAPITSKVFSKEFPTNVKLTRKESGLSQESTTLLNQIRTIDKSRIIKTYKILDGLVMQKVNQAIHISLALEP